MEDVVDQIALDHLEGVKIKAEYISASCPFHGTDRHPSFWIERATGKWGCFTCQAGGSGIKWLLKELGVRKRGIDHLLEEAEKDRKKTAAIAKVQRRRKAKAKFNGTHVLPENILGLWNMCPQALLDDGFSEELLREHDIGFDEKRLRITFPIRDIDGNLIGISGRSVDDSWPKYKVDQGYHDKVLDDGRTGRDPGELGAWFPDYSSTDIRNHLYRGNFVYHKCFDGDGDYLIIVEGYKAALWMVQLGYRNTVALMGAKMSATQERLVRRMGVPTFVLLDNNDAGQDGADYACSKLGNCTFPVYRCWYPEDQDEEAQPDDLSEEEAEAVLEGATRAAGRVRRRKTTWSQ
jgi:DNA primase